MKNQKDERLIKAIEILKQGYEHCTLCPKNCMVNRLQGETGTCGVGRNSKVFNTVLLVNETEEITPTYAIYFAGCNLQCKFCSVANENELIAAVDDSDKKKDYGDVQFPDVDDKFVERVKREIEEVRPKTISFIGGEPSVHLLTILELIQKLEPSLPLVFFSNMYYKPRINRILLECFDMIIADLHYGNDECAHNLSGAKKFVEIAANNIAAVREKLILRHLLLPGHHDCCYKKIADWVKYNLPEHTLHLLTQYFPYNIETNPTKRTLQIDEINRALNYAESIGLHVKTLNLLRDNKDLQQEQPHIQNITITEDGTVAFKYITKAALETAYSIGGEDHPHPSLPLRGRERKREGG